MCFRKQHGLLDTGHLEPYYGIAIRIARRSGSTLDIDIEHLRIPTSKERALAKFLEGFFPIEKSNNIRDKIKWSLNDMLASSPMFRVVSARQVSYLRRFQRTRFWYH